MAKEENFVARKRNFHEREQMKAEKFDKRRSDRTTWRKQGDKSLSLGGSEGDCQKKGRGDGGSNEQWKTRMEKGEGERGCTVKERSITEGDSSEGTINA